MAKRRRLTAPNADELRELESGFAAKPLEAKSMTPPIAQVAGESAALSALAGVTDRVVQARNETDAALFRDAQQAGLVAVKIPVTQIDAEYIHRDRVAEDPGAMAELVASIRTRGLRAPIEVVKTEDGYGLISGFRRLMAFQSLVAEDTQYGTIPAFVRETGAGASAYVSMVEENEVRANLTHYERGRIAVLATGQAVFASIEEAVEVLFSTASKAKRSKVRSFALVHEQLGDLLSYPTALTEKAGLRVATALRDGEQSRLRAALAGAECQNAAEEWRVLDKALRAVIPAGSNLARGGRPSEVARVTPVTLSKGGVLSAQVSRKGMKIELEGRAINPDTAERILQQIKRFLD